MEKLKAFLKQRENQLLLLILVFAFALRLYFFFKTYNQALWWDEADYMGIAKHYAFGTMEAAAPWRARGMSLIFGIFYFFGATESFQRIIVILMSVGAVWLTFLLGKEFFNKKIALIASCFMSVLWIHLFWGARFSGETFALIFYGFAGYFFWKGYVKNESKWYMIASGALIAYGIFLYDSVGAIFLFLPVYLVVTERFKFLKNKQFWWGMLGLAIVLSFVFWHYYDLYGQIYPRVYHIVDGSLLEGQELDQKLEEQGFLPVFLTTFVFFTNMLDYFHWVILIVFLIGLIYYIDLIVGFDMVIKNTNEKLKKDFFIFWWALSVMLFFGLYLAAVKTYYEPRYIFPAYPILFLIAAQGVVYIADHVEKYKKHLGTVAILAIIGFAAFDHITYANALIDNKKTSYSQERTAGEWLKEHTEKDDVIFVCNEDVQFIYYTERNIFKADGYNITDMASLIEEHHPKYYVLDFYLADCELDYVTQYQDQFTVAQTFNEGDSPAVVILEVKYEE